MRARGIPKRALPHVDLVAVEALKGAGAAGRTFLPEFVLDRAQIVDGVGLTGTQYEREAEVSGVVYCARSSFPDALPMPDSRVRIWAGTPDERYSVLKRTERYEHPEIADVVVLVLS